MKSLNELVQGACKCSAEAAEEEIQYVVECLRNLNADNDLRYSDLDDAVSYLGLEPDYLPLIMALV